MGMMRSCARHSVCFLSFTMWVAGCAVIGCMLWILATSPALRDFFMGTTIFSYVVIGIGGILFLNGLIGWIGSYRRGNCVMKLFLLVAVLTVAAEIGGIVAFNILDLKMTDVFENGWKEVNENTKNIIQDQLHCCGFLGPEDFTVNTEPIHESCYTKITPGNSTSTTTEVRKLNRFSPPNQVTSKVRTLNRIGCKERLLEWFYMNKYTWIGSLGGILLFQVASVLFAVYLINQLGRSRRSSSESLDVDVDPMHHHPQPYF
ncbi:tetraspanin-9 isoform X1 [Parasteatoda tepidariorum]|uniref:tetraspanin-9 isoform X1 n=1 Tax=Parasteatoda tepidariorum TaxID=114398 RepID=UPI00077F872B|nr:tetraspanin-9 isoform X1 [Parasteatoda tepidariorum]